MPTKKPPKKSIKQKSKPKQKQGSTKQKKDKKAPITIEKTQPGPKIVDSMGVEPLGVPELPSQTPKRPKPPSEKSKSGRPPGRKDTKPRKPRKPPESVLDIPQQPGIISGGGPPGIHETIDPRPEIDGLEAARITAEGFVAGLAGICDAFLPPPLSKKEQKALEQTWTPVIHFYQDQWAMKPWTPAVAVTVLIMGPRVGKGLGRLIASRRTPHSVDSRS